MKNKLREALNSSPNTADSGANPGTNTGTNTGAETNQQHTVSVAPSRVSGLKRARKAQWGNENTISVKDGLWLHVEGGIIIPILDTTTDMLVQHGSQITTLIEQAVASTGVTGLLVTPTTTEDISSVEQLVEGYITNRLDDNHSINGCDISATRGTEPSTVQLRIHPITQQSRGISLFEHTAVQPLQVTLVVVVDRTIELNMIIDDQFADVPSQTMVWAALEWVTRPSQITKILSLAGVNKKVIVAAKDALKEGTLTVAPSLLFNANALDLLTVMVQVEPAVLMTPVASSDTYVYQDSDAPQNRKGLAISGAQVVSADLNSNLSSLRNGYSGPIKWAALYDPSTLSKYASLCPERGTGFDFGFTIANTANGSLPNGNGSFRYY